MLTNIGTKQIETGRLILRRFEYADRLYYSILRDEFMSKLT